MPPLKKALKAPRRDSQSSDESNQNAATPEPTTSSSPSINLFDLPIEVLEHIFRCLPFGTISKIRLVSRSFNDIGSSVLNSEFQRIRLTMQRRFQSIKAQMPRRESARRKHPLARESDIVETLYMRLTLLQMTFGKHIERKQCCFFAGEILDEVYKILSYIKSTPNLSRVYKVTDELFDLSTMAMEYFKEHIEPTLPEISYFSTDIFDYSTSLSCTSSPKTQLYLMDEATPSTSTRPLSPPEGIAPRPKPRPIAPAVKKRLRKLRESVRRNNGQVVTLKRDLTLTQRRVNNQQKQIHELKAHYDEYDKKLQTTSRKLNAVLQELSRCKTELQYWRSKSPAAHCTCGKVTPDMELLLKDFPSNNNQLLEPDLLDDDEEEEEEFKPIDSECLPASGVAPTVLVVPACHQSTTPFTVTGSISVPLNQDRKTVIKGLGKPMTRACKRKLDMDHKDIILPPLPSLKLIKKEI